MKVLAFSALVNALAATGLGMFVYFRDPAAATQPDLRAVLSEHCLLECLLLRLAAY